MGAGTDLWNLWETLYNQHDWAGFVSVFTSDAVYVGAGRRYEGCEAIKAYFEQTVGSTISDNFETSVVVLDRATVAAEWTSRATYTGTPDRTVEVPGVSVCTIRDGKFATMHDYYDTADVMRQLGLASNS